MNDLRHPCEDWAEPISLAAAGCLSPDEDQEVRRHIETCSACRERFRKLTQLCGTLAELRLPSNSAETAIVERVMSAVASGTRLTFLTRSLSTWRWIMRSPVSRLAAAAIFVLALGGVALWFHGGTTPALADFLQPLLEAKTVKYKVTTEVTSPLAGTMDFSAETLKDLLSQTAVVMMPDAHRSRTETPISGKLAMVNIQDMSQGKGLLLQPAEKRATVFHSANRPKDKTPKGKDRRSASPRGGPGEPWPVAAFRSLLRDPRGKPGVKRESLGQQEIDGSRVVGFRISSSDTVVSFWGDPKTGLPVRIESTMATMPYLKVTMSDFALNVPMDESLFSVEPPAGYEVTAGQYRTEDDTPGKERDLIEMFRQYSQLCGGSFPDLLDKGSFSTMFPMKNHMENQLQKPDKPSAKQEQERAEAWAKLQQGLIFIGLLPKEATPTRGRHRLAAPGRAAADQRGGLSRGSHRVRRGPSPAIHGAICPATRHRHSSRIFAK